MKERQELENKLREKTHIGVKHHFGNSFGGDYYEQEFCVNCEPDEIWINHMKYNKKLQEECHRIVDLLHEILEMGSRMRQEEIYAIGENYGYLESEACRILDILKE